jgi:hypothetical protein
MEEVREMRTRNKVACALIAGGIALAISAPAGANMLLNPGFELGETTNWTVSAGALTGTGLGADPYSGSKSWHGAWNYSGGGQTTTYYQDVPFTYVSGMTAQATMWCKADAYGGVWGNDTHYFQLSVRLRNTANTANVTSRINVNSLQPNNTWQQVTLNLATGDIPSTAGYARVFFSYITTQAANAWKVWNIDDLSFTVTPEPTTALLLLPALALVRRRR